MEFKLAGAGSRIRLGVELGRGGEGGVFALDGRSDQVAKIYSAPPEAGKANKLRTMVEAANPALLKIAAWPSDLLIDNKGAVRGFVMPRAGTLKDIHELYTPKSRAESFPAEDFRFLVHVGANIARAFAMIHELGHIIGDINHGNILVGADATVMLIDCDSFQIRNGSTVFTCDVGVPLFTAPELHGRQFRGLVRTTNHDRFGLAVLLFHLLYMGRHPYAGKYSGTSEMPIEKAIAQHRFAYGANRNANGMERPPGTIPLETMGPGIAARFERAFAVRGAIEGRPNAKSWTEELVTLESSLRVCPTASWHHFPAALNSCPWCVVESHTGARLFGLRVPLRTATGSIDLATLLRAIEAVPSPGPDPAMPSERPWSPPPGVELPSPLIKGVRQTVSFGIAGIGLYAWMALIHQSGVLWALIAAVVALLVWPRHSPKERSEADRVFSAAKAQWGSVLIRWQREATYNLFDQKRLSLQKICAELSEIPKERRRRLARLEGERESRQRQRYLDRFRIDQATIQGIGSGLTSMLASYGVETAADIEWGRIIQIPGFAEKRTAELVRWRQNHDGNFRFNPREPVDRRDIEAIDRELEARRQRLAATARQGPQTLTNLAREISASRVRLMPLLDQTWTAFKVAEARRKAL